MSGINTRYALAMLVAAALPVTGCGSGEQRGSAPPPPATRSNDGQHSRAAKPFDATLTASTHRPVVGKPWHWSVRVTTREGKLLAAVVKPLYLFGGQIVGRSGQRRFVGVHHGAIRWPQRSVGFPLVFRAAISTAKGRLLLDYPVQVRK